MQMGKNMPQHCFEDDTAARHAAQHWNQTAAQWVAKNRSSAIAVGHCDDLFPAWAASFAFASTYVTVLGGGAGRL